MFKYATAIFFILSAFLLQRTIAQSEKIDTLNTEVNTKSEAIDFMQSKIENFSKAEDKANKTINELRKKANEDKCYNSPLPDYIIEQLQS